jgi:3-oxoacyl-[acyl-carrier-protein] synthase II
VHTGGTTQADDEIAFDLVLREPRKMNIEWLLLNAFGFGGQNSSLVVSAVRSPSPSSAPSPAPRTRVP